MLVTCQRLMPYSAHSSLTRFVLTRIANACSCVSFCLPPTYRRSRVSRMLSLCEPQYRCAGLQQALLSQVWQACCLSGGGGPFSAIRTARCVLCGFPSWLICPYPVVVKEAVHGQHSSGSRMSTFAHNLVRNGPRTYAALGTFNPMPRAGPLLPSLRAGPNVPGSLRPGRPTPPPSRPHGPQSPRSSQRP